MLASGAPFGTSFVPSLGPRRAKRNSDFVATRCADCVTLAWSQFRRKEAAMSEFTPYQQKIVKRYYDNLDTLQRQRLAALVSDLYLSEGKKKARLWKDAAAAMQKLKVPPSRIEHLLKQQKPELLAELVKELG